MLSMTGEHGALCRRGGAAWSADIHAVRPLCQSLKVLRHLALLGMWMKGGGVLALA